MRENQFVILEDNETKVRFFQLSAPNDPTRNLNGVAAFRVLGYAQGVQEAKDFLAGLPTRWSN